MLPDSKSMLDLTKTDLSQRLKALNGVVIDPPVRKDFKLTDIQNGVGEHGVKEWLSKDKWKYTAKQPAIYVISADSVETASAISTTFDAPRPVDDPSYKRPQRNKKHDGSRVIYVGSSITGIRPRLKQHLWECGLKTYALHLHRWAHRVVAKPDSFLSVEVVAIKDPSGMMITQNLEDALWKKLQPLLGKLGAH